MFVMFVSAPLGLVGVLALFDGQWLLGGLALGIAIPIAIYDWLLEEEEVAGALIVACLLIGGVLALTTDLDRRVVSEARHTFNSGSSDWTDTPNVPQ